MHRIFLIYDFQSIIFELLFFLSINPVICFKNPKKIFENLLKFQLQIKKYDKVDLIIFLIF